MIDVEARRRVYRAEEPVYWSGDNVTAFPVNNVDCGDSGNPTSLMSRMTIIRYGMGKLAFDNECVPAAVNKSGCATEVTEYVEGLGGVVSILSRHNVACPAGKALFHWRMDWVDPRGKTPKDEYFQKEWPKRYNTELVAPHTRVLYTCCPGGV